MPESTNHRVFVPAGRWSTHLISTVPEETCGTSDIEDFEEFLQLLPERRLIFLFTDFSLKTVSRFLQILPSSHAVALIDGGSSPEILDRLITAYNPDVLISGDEIRSVVADGPPVHPDLKVLLSTSGTTGTVKFVRLSRRNIESSAEQVVQSLAITRNDVAVTALPLHYSFGMSVVTSHALAGADLVVSGASVITPDFWEVLDKTRVTFLPVVPQSLNMLHRIGWEHRLPDSVHVIAQAGGRGNQALLHKAWNVMDRRGGRFHVMYGQTEASPRITCLPSDEFPIRPESVGLPMPGGLIRIDTSVSGAAIDSSHGEPIGEVVYSGPNVMMGYADDRNDLSDPGDTNMDLRTGDLGFLDTDGFLYLTGRLTRIAKLASARISLDEVEQILGAHIEGPLATIARGDDGVLVCVEQHGTLDAADVKRTCARVLGVTPTLVEVVVMDSMPLLSSGKVDYTKLAAITQVPWTS
jgi:acyl-CoA synthetase (AMP-forming)/AMP-acid ligase II